MPTTSTFAASFELVVWTIPSLDASAVWSLRLLPGDFIAIVENDLSHQLEEMAGTGAWVTINGSLYKKPADQKKKSLPVSLMLTIVEIQKE
jgi:hypothetical protein